MKILFMIVPALAMIPTLAAQTTPRTFLDKYCITCHNQKLHTAGLAKVASAQHQRRARRAIGDSEKGRYALGRQ